MNHPQSLPITMSAPSNDVVVSGLVISDFDQYCWSLVALEKDEGWQSELWQYLKDMPANVTAKTDIICYWQNNYKLYPTLGCIALNILLIPASSAPCKHLFCAAKKISNNCCVCLGQTKFEELQLMRFAWHNNICDRSTWHSALVEVDDLQEF